MFRGCPFLYICEIEESAHHVPVDSVPVPVFHGNGRDDSMLDERRRMNQIRFMPDESYRGFGGILPGGIVRADSFQVGQPLLSSVSSQELLIGAQANAYDQNVQSYGCDHKQN